MLTHNLKDLKRLKAEASARPGEDARITVWPSFSKDEIVERIAGLYIVNVEFKRREINKTLRHLYNRDLVFHDKDISDIYLKIEKFLQDAQKGMGDVAKEFRTYLGYRCSFYRREGDRSVPIDSERLREAYFAMRDKKPKRVIEKILYE
jgi:hypothetical protein